jgi:hypothetical protein
MERIEHHIWCNFTNKDPNNCKLCDRLFKEYPMEDKSPEKMIETYFPDVITRDQTMGFSLTKEQDRKGKK